MGEALKKRIKQDQFESSLQEALLNLMVAAGHVRERVERISLKFGITHGQYNVLRILKGAYPAGYARGEIAHRMLERAPDVTRLLDKLEERGLVVRDRSGTDRRMSVARISDQGVKLLETIQPAMSEVFQYFSERISLKDRRELSRICEGLYDEEGN